MKIFSVDNFDSAESNFPAAFLNLAISFMAVFALMSDRWILIDDSMAQDESDDGNLTINRLLEKRLALISSDSCSRIGTRNFWQAAGFGSFVDLKGVYHITYHAGGKIFVDCITPLLADYFYLMIIFCFIIFIKSTIGSVLHVAAPTNGFLRWLRRSAVFELCSAAASFFAFATFILAYYEILDIRPNSSVNIYWGMIFVLLPGFASLLTAIISFQGTHRLACERRIHNQRLICNRSLHSWREASNQSDPNQIIDFERYLESPGTHCNAALSLDCELLLRNTDTNSASTLSV